MVSTVLALIGILFALFGYELNTVVYLIAVLPILPLELSIGVWLTIKGFRQQEKNPRPATTEKQLEMR